VHYFKIILSILWFLTSASANALPIGFGVNQGDIKYKRIKGPHFWIYHDARAPYEAAFAYDLLEEARPLMDQWFAKSRNKLLPVINSAVSSNASFANFVTDAIEIQSLGHGPRDLFWHELVHNYMYLHLQNILGPPGTVLHLLWMPAWFIEGLAESLSVSVGSDVQAGIERYQALTKDWPSYDRVHSLYTSGDFALRGYSLSGAFVSWLLRENNPERLPFVLKDFWDYTMPWYWLWAAVPFNNFMPMDRTLENFAGGKGRELFYKYQAAAQNYWSGHRSNNGLLIERKGNRRNFSSISALHSEGNDSFVYFQDPEANHRVFRYRLNFSEKSGFATGASKTEVQLPEEVSSLTHGDFDDFKIAVSSKQPSARSALVYDQLVKIDKAGKEAIVYYPESGYVNEVFATADKVAFQMRRFDKTSFCWFAKKLLDGPLPLGPKQIRCRKAQLPQTLSVLGAKKGTTLQTQGLASEIWLSLETQSATQDTYDILVWDAEDGSIKPIGHRQVAKPIAASFSKDGIWLLQGERSGRTLRKLNAEGLCETTITMDDLPLSFTALEDGRLVLNLYRGSQRNVLLVDPKSLNTSPCYEAPGHTSPLLQAIKSSNSDLGEAFAKASIWQTPDQKVLAPIIPRQSSLINPFGQKLYAQLALPSDSADPAPPEPKTDVVTQGPPPQITPPVQPPIPELESITGEKTESKAQQKKVSQTPESEDAGWTTRTVLPAVPWLGANDPLGTQIGIISVPLMDHLQNETLRLTFLYGIDSRFPNTDLSFTSTRFWPTISISGFRQQTWNGTFYSRAQQGWFSSYLEETGIIYSMVFPWTWKNQGFSLSTGAKASELKPYLGPWRVRSGTLVEPFANVNYRYRFISSSLNLGLQFRFAAEEITEDFAYDQLGLSASYSYALPFWQSTLLTGIEGSRTRGSKTHLLQEYYRPLKTFIPGSGGGQNQNTVNIAGLGSLFTSRYGNNQARYRLNYTVPLIQDLDYFLWLFYFQRLDFTAFFNYGGAWVGDRSPDSDQLVAAHGYNMDLQFENKGVGFHTGIGTGQVFEEDFQIYVKFGFDAIF
jgi:hypothetical protein